MSNRDKTTEVARQGEEHMNRLADQLGDLGDDARRWAQTYGDNARK